MIRVIGVSKKFRIYSSPVDRLKEVLLNRPYHREFDALSNVSFEVGPGETLGIIGENGAGKSTLLKLLAGVLLPDSGTIETSGKVTGLLELGTGFNAELTGLENINLNGTFLGLSREDIEGKKQDIINFTELGEFIKEPIKTYSSGMLMRLGFAIAIHANPACFLVDEALSVGDAYFQQKCMRKIQEFKENGGSIIFVSHDMNAIRVLCDSVILISNGKYVDYGNPKEVLDNYNIRIIKKLHDKNTNNPHDISSTKSDINSLVSTGEIELSSIEIYDLGWHAVNNIISGDSVNIKLILIINSNLIDPHYGIVIRNKYGQSIFETNTFCMNIKTKPVRRNQEIEIIWNMYLPLTSGVYSLSIGVANIGLSRGEFKEYQFFMNDVKTFSILENPHAIQFSGICNLSPSVEIKENNEKIFVDYDYE